MYLKELSCDTLFQIEDFVLHPRYIFNTGGRMVPYELQDLSRRAYFSGLNGTDVEDRYEKYVIILKIFENKKHLYFTIEYRKQLYPAIYDKLENMLRILPAVTVPSSRRDQTISFYGFENDLDDGLPFWPMQIISDKEMMCVYSAEELLRLDESKITDEKLKKLLYNLDEDSNTVVAIVTLKG